MSIVSNDYINKAIPRLPIELRRYIYGYIYDEVKVFYWLDKYKWDNQLDTLFQFYEESFILEKYYEKKENIGVKGKGKGWDGKIREIES